MSPRSSAVCVVLLVFIAMILLSRSQTRATIVARLSFGNSSPTVHTPRTCQGELSQNLKRFGIKAFGSAQALAEVLIQSSCENVTMIDYQRRPFEMLIHHFTRDVNWRNGMGDNFVERECPKPCRKGLLRRPPGLFMEIGANIGMGTVFAHKSYPGLRTISVEASPRNAFFLKWNLEANGIAESSEAVVLNNAMGCNGTVQYKYIYIYTYMYIYIYIYIYTK